MAIEDAVTGILLCTYNGANFLDEQLASIEQQTHLAWRLMVSDDGSTDDTLDIIEKFRTRHPDRVSLVSGEGKGFVRNFMSVAASPAFAASYWAFCDQDDIWEADKLARAVAELSNASPDIAALYCSRTQFVDEEGNSLGFSPVCMRAPSFQNALVQNISSGNTMVFNEVARKLLCAADNDALSFHDWLLYLVVTGCGGSVFYDLYPSIRYRQHGKNILGPLGSWKGYLSRAKLILGGGFKSWIDGNLVAMSKIQLMLTESNRNALTAFVDMRRQGVAQRLIALHRHGITHQTRVGRAAITLAALCNRL
jgi:glycosyltransferase involved in cell wall biosynthesis